MPDPFPMPAGLKCPLAGTLPRGETDYGDLRRKGQVYVDKTHRLARLLEENELYVFLSRPRRFGKSLLISTLKHLFAKDEELFAGTHIRGLPLWAELPTCPVLVLDMSELGMHLAPVSEFPVRLRDYVDEKTAACALACLPPDKPADAALRHLLQGLQALHGQKVVVLVDEYDAPLTGCLERTPAIPDAESQFILGCLRDFYRLLKSQRECLQFVFLTGISRVEGAGLFSALHNLRDISQDIVYADICGFTEAELEVHFQPHLEDGVRHLKCTMPDLRARLREHYNGYLFDPDGAPVYNPHSVLEVLTLLSDSRRARRIKRRGACLGLLPSGQPETCTSHVPDRIPDPEAGTG